MTTPPQQKQDAPEANAANPPLFQTPLHRRRLLSLFAGGFGSLAVGGALRTWRVLQPPVITFPPVSLPSPNAYDGCMKAIGLLKKSSDRLTDSFRAEYAAPTSKNRPDILTLAQKRAIVSENAPALAALRAALAHSYHEPPIRVGWATIPNFARFVFLPACASPTAT